MSKKSIFYLSSVLMLPVLYAGFYLAHISSQGQAIEAWVNKWDRLTIIAAIIILERVYTYRYAVNQRFVLKRDIIANIVNLYITGAVTAFLLLPVLLLANEHLFGRKAIFASPDQLGPFWFQIVTILVIVSFFRYWMHRMQHTVPFLWELHSYHHRVTDLTATNGEVSNPIDFALRNVIIFVALGVVGFDPAAILLTFPAANLAAVFSHCAADLKGGVLNYLFVTPQVHRWHHSREVPQGYGYSCNYSVEFPIWDILFGTFYLPQKDGQIVQPEHIGHPSGLPDEPNYAKLLLMPIGLYRPLPALARTRTTAQS